MPLLTYFKGHEKVFENAKQLTLENFSVLKTVSIGQFAFTNLDELILRNDMALESFLWDKNPPLTVKSIVLSGRTVFILS